MPEGFLDRALRKAFGPLTIHVASREDLLKLKLLAALRRGATGRRQIGDLVRAAPTSEELAAAAAWVRSRTDDSERLEAVIGELASPS